MRVSPSLCFIRISPCSVTSSILPSKAVPSAIYLPISLCLAGIVGVRLTSRFLYQCHPSRLYRQFIYSAFCSASPAFSVLIPMRSISLSDSRSILYSCSVISRSDVGLGALPTHSVWLIFTPIPAMAYSILLPAKAVSISMPHIFLSS